MNSLTCNQWPKSASMLVSVTVVASFVTVPHARAQSLPEPKPIDCELNLDPQQLASNERSLAQTLYQLGDYDTALPHFENAAALYDTLGQSVNAARTSNEIGQCLREMGRCEQAIVAHYRAIGGLSSCGDTSGVAESRGYLAQCLQAMELFTEAADWFEWAAADFDRLNQPINAAWTYGRLGDCYRKLKEDARAAQAYAESVQRFLVVGNSQQLANNERSLAQTLYQLGNYDTALPHFENAAALYDTLGQSVNAAWVYGWMGDCEDRCGRVLAAIPHREECAIRLRQFSDTDLRDLALAINNLGNALLKGGRREEALSLLEEAFDIRRQLFKGDHADIAESQNNIAVCLRELGRVIEARPYYEDALAMRRRLARGKDDLAVAQSCINLGVFLRTSETGSAKNKIIRLYREAIGIYERVLGTDNDNLAAAHSNLAKCLVPSQDAIKEAAIGLEMRRRVFGDIDHRDIAFALDTLAHCLRLSGSAADAIAPCKAALDMRTRLLGQDHPNVGGSYHHLGMCFEACSDFDAAIKNYALAVSIGERASVPDTQVWATAAAKIEIKRQRLTEAEHWLEIAIGQIELARNEAHCLTPEDRAGQFAFWRRCGAYELMVDVQLRLLELASQSSDTRGVAEHERKALEYLEMGLARAALDVLEQSTRAIASEVAERANRDPRLRAQYLETEDEFQSAKSNMDAMVYEHSRWKISSQPSTEQLGEKIGELARKLPAARERYKRACAARQQLWARVLPGLTDLGSPASATECRKLLSKDERLLYYAIGETTSRAILVSRDEPLRTIDLIWPEGDAVTGANLGASVGRYRQSLIRRGDMRQCAELAGIPIDGAGNADQIMPGECTPRDSVTMRTGLDIGLNSHSTEMLHEGPRLFAALAPTRLWNELQRSRRVYVVTNSVALSQVPLEALIVDSQDDLTQYWIDSGPEIVYAPSASFLLRASARRAAQRRQDADRAHSTPLFAVLVGDPLFGRSTFGAFPDTGALITQVDAAGVAASLGLARDDVVVRFDGNPIENRLHFLRLRASAQTGQIGSGTRVSMSVWRPSDNETREYWIEVDQHLGAELAIQPPAEYVRLRMASEERRIMSRSRYDRLKRLPGTRREVQGIYRSLTGEPLPPEVSYAMRQATPEHAGAVAMLAERASEGELYRFFDRSGYHARILHLATHGVSDADGPYCHSSVALTLPAQPTIDDNGFLELSDLFTRWRDKLNRCELVVLSACETQIGPQHRGDAAFSLPLGFQYAGCPASVASLWQVEDDATAELMSKFYVLMAGEATPAGNSEKASLFWQARQEFRKLYPDPYFWAPFIYVGAPQ